jgi:hypothetical protein
LEAILQLTHLSLKLVIVRAAVLLAFSGASAFSAPITWTLDATLDDGATVTGTFVYNPDAGFQDITNFNIQVSAATIPTLTEPLDEGLPTSIFPAFDFTPSNSDAAGPFSDHEGSFSFLSDDFTYDGGDSLVLQFVPLSPLTDLSPTTITNADINVNAGNSTECYDCNPYVCFAGATSSLCAPSTVQTTTPEPAGSAFGAVGVCALYGVLMVARRRGSLVQRAAERWISFRGSFGG